MTTEREKAFGNQIFFSTNRLQYASIQDKINYVVQMGDRGRTSINDYDPAEGQELILEFSYDMPRVIYENDLIVAQEVNEVLATIEETFYTGQDYGLKQEFIGYHAMLESAEDTASELAARVDALRRSDSYLFIGRGDGMATGLSHGAGETDVDSMSDYDYYSRIRMKDSAQG